MRFDRQTPMQGGGDGENQPPRRGPTDDNIRWLLAAVLHHEPDEDPGVDVGED
jgi:hypothetical protein